LYTKGLNVIPIFVLDTKKRLGFMDKEREFDSGCVPDAWKPRGRYNRWGLLFGFRVSELAVMLPGSFGL